MTIQYKNEDTGANNSIASQVFITSAMFYQSAILTPRYIVIITTCCYYYIILRYRYTTEVKEETKKFKLKIFCRFDTMT